jgi:hypothetical protein
MFSTATKSDTTSPGNPALQSGAEVGRVADRLCPLPLGKVEDP